MSDELSLSPPPANEPAPSASPAPFRPSPRMWRISGLLFGLTCLSTFYIGARHYNGVVPAEFFWQAVFADGPQAQFFQRAMLRSGLLYAGPLMATLLFHEFGHYLQARRYHVPAMPPMFIPMPFFPFGTMGAVIVQSPRHADRKAMFDIAISGPLAGLLVALPVAWLGILESKVKTIAGGWSGFVFNEPLLMRWMVEAVHGPLATDQTVIINPLLMAGWVGIFITALNLTPIGQLDGGHILYCLIGKRAHVVAVLFVWLVAGYMIATQYWAFSVMLLLITMMGIRHPPTANDQVPLGRVRVVLGWLTLAFLLIGINPRPIDVLEPAAAEEQAVVRAAGAVKFPP
jgi:membrane-associated protease RseP (regulator of RpoE activity)